VGRVRSLAGIALLVLGVAGTILPLMPGVPFLIAGTALLGSDHPMSRAIAGGIRRLRSPRRKESS
jgi:uncharacterized membrane protein YbaN (DUF454 family)